MHDACMMHAFSKQNIIRLIDSIFWVYWRHRHNSTLHLIKQMCLWAGVPCDLEVFNLFSAALRKKDLTN